jgi:hypothetical protein
MNFKSLTRRTLKQNMKGQVAVIMVLLTTAMLGAVAMGTDAALLYVNWVNLQKAADSAAVAGAEYLPDASFSAADASCVSYSADAQKAACSYALLNKVAAAEIQSIQVAADSKSITIKLQRNVPGFFSRVLGMTTYPVGVTATAASQPVSATGQSIPIGVQFTTPYVNGTAVALHAGGYGPGNWGALSLGCNGASCFSSNLLNNYQGQVNVADTVSSETGAITGPTRTSVTTRVANGLAEYPTGSWNSHAFDDPRVAIVALVDWTGCNGHCSVPVKGFATVWLTGSDGSTINAVFIGQAFGTPLYTAAGTIDAGTYHVTLIR